ncbi:unnamed protein product [Rotaria sp. Silwood1]|nr:unnamed protein product [Rotaria sp. Silwood1]CAF3338531.1 unnamed protein product [Rotaria sp. Silwood1]CAF3401749.1 unnamed protein product [Rotaria sp. Silwood1]CAF4534213.1 unnamed protein product [Rotaria sp. Silwood1]CAF4635415.1 unnamed protein product [Rotaria sp. Silwood1]
MNGSTNAPLSTTPSSDKLSGQLIIKAQLGDDIRKMMIHNEDLTLNELVLMMERIFAGKISNSDELTIKYLDDDGDKITLLNDSDLTVALHFHKVLRLFVLVNGDEQLTNNNSTAGNLNKEGSLIDAKTFRNELQQIRNSVQTILDRLQLSTNQDITNGQEKEVTTTATATIPTPAFVSSTAREFDPYKHLHQSQRSTTPDSIRSKSSNSNKPAYNEQKSFQTIPTVDKQNQYQSSESTDANKPSPTSFQQMPTPHFVPTGINDQQTKISSSLFGPPPTSFSGMPPLPNASTTSRFPTPFPPQTLPNANTTSAFNSSSAPPPPPPSSNTAQTSTFIGQQQQAPPSQQGGFYGQQQALMQQRLGFPTFNPNINTPPNAYIQQQPQAPPSSSSPATINPSFIQPTSMPTPPPLASQQPYGGYPPQNAYYNPAQQYPKTS